MSQTLNSKSTCFKHFIKGKKSQQTHPKEKNKTKNKQTDTCCQKPPSVNFELEQLHSPAHISSEGLLQYSIGNYISTAFQKSSSTEPKVSPRLNYLADLIKKNLILALYDRRQLAHSTRKYSIFFLPMTWLPDSL